ncbi:Thymidylate kinase [Trichinella spiralis]|uniref:Thymidylate kinase n=2 Tax=Trichinella spiralis TaxID=6334 RepID=A0A0V1BJ19_TRISP|nr:Thymidylate kinase [Trichinella spiralis]
MINSIIEWQNRYIQRLDPTIVKRVDRYIDAVKKSRSSRQILTLLPQRMVLNASEKIWKNYLRKADFGLLPKEYNKKIHGPYCPWRYYGKKDTNIFDVKLADFSAWMSRRDTSARGIMAAMSRGYYLWIYYWFSPRVANVAPLCHLLVFMAFARMILNHNNFKRDQFLMENCRGALIVFEGLDRSGKTTQVRLLSNFLQCHAFPVVTMRFPTRAGVIGEMLDQYLNKKVEMENHVAHLLFSADRWAVHTEIENNIKCGTTVIVDRYLFSGIAFSAAKGLDFDWCMNADRGLPQPDVVFFVDVKPETLKNRGEFGVERFDDEEFQRKVRHNYQRLTDKYWQVIDGEKSQKEIADQIERTVCDLLKSPAMASPLKMFGYT